MTHCLRLRNSDHISSKKHRTCEPLVSEASWCRTNGEVPTRSGGYFENFCVRCDQVPVGEDVSCASQDLSHLRPSSRRPHYPGWYVACKLEFLWALPIFRLPFTDSSWERLVPTSGLTVHIAGSCFLTNFGRSELRTLRYVRNRLLYGSTNVRHLTVGYKNWCRSKSTALTSLKCNKTVYFTTILF